LVAAFPDRAPSKITVAGIGTVEWAESVQVGESVVRALVEDAETPVLESPELMSEAFRKAMIEVAPANARDRSSIDPQPSLGTSADALHQAVSDALRDVAARVKEP
jgi:hypothetical protein